jgi:hypothetical protein
LFANNGKQDVPFGRVNTPIADHVGRMKRGSQTLNMWEAREKAHPANSCEQNWNPCLPLKIQFEDVSDPIVFFDLNIPLSEPKQNENEHFPKTVIEEILHKG